MNQRNPIADPLRLALAKSKDEREAWTARELMFLIRRILNSPVTLVQAAAMCVAMVASGELHIEGKRYVVNRKRERAAA